MCDAVSGSISGTNVALPALGALRLDVNGPLLELGIESDVGPFATMLVTAASRCGPSERLKKFTKKLIGEGAPSAWRVNLKIIGILRWLTVLHGKTGRRLGKLIAAMTWCSR